MPKPNQRVKNVIAFIEKLIVPSGKGAGKTLFGLTPAARASLGIKNEPRGKSKFDGLIGIKGGKR